MNWRRWLRRPRGSARVDAAGRGERDDEGPATERQPAESPDTGALSGVRTAQINIRGDADLIGRFRTLCRAERRTYADMLRVLLDAYEARERRD